jgi:cytochrome c oxidase cbb3-type subunit 1
MANSAATAGPSSGVYSDTVVRLFALAAVLWGVVGMLVGVIIAAQLTWPELNLGISFLSYGRLRPLHTNAVIFAFGGCALFATSYHVVQRTCQTRLFAPGPGHVHLLGLEVGHPRGGHHLAAGADSGQGIR